MISAWGLYLYALVMIGLILIIDGKHRVLIWLTPVAVACLLTLVLQRIFRRERPQATRTSYDLFVHTYSFPSAHAATSMAFATSLAYAFVDSHLQYGWVFAFFWFLIALLIALSRVVVGVHYALDVLAGAMLGYLAAYLFFGV